MLNIIQMTDTHIFTDPDAELYGVNTRRSLNAVMQHINQSKINPDMVWLTGDLSHDETESSYRILESMLQQWNVPKYCVPGNHDAPVFMENVFPHVANKNIVVLDKGPWLLVGLDSSIQGEVEGELTVDALNQLQQLINNNPHKHLLLAVHHPPVKVGSAWMDRIGMQNGDALLNILNSHNATKVIICGHIHQELEVSNNDICVYGTPSSCFQFAPLTQEAAIDDKPPGYRQLTLFDNGRVETQVFSVHDWATGL